MKMKCIAKIKPEKGLEILDYEVPKIGYNETLIKIKKAGICGTDLHIYNYDEWAKSRLKLPIIVGHEFVGEVVEIGKGVKFIKPGDRVSAEGHIVCGHCRFCRTGQAHICEKTQIIGVDINGCFAEYLKMPAENLWPVTKGIPDKYAAIFDPLGNAMHTIMSGNVSGKSVLIIGAGAIGLFAIPLSKSAGANFVIVVEPNQFKCKLAKKLGADKVFKPQTKNLRESIMDLTDGLGPEVILEMSGNPNGIKFGFDIIRNGGTFVMLGIPSTDFTINWAKDVIFKGITINGVSGRRLYDTWYRCQGFLEKNYKLIEPIITMEINYTEFEKGFDLMNTGSCGKIILNF
jgi:threonine 3-dehydrogenase